MRLLIINPNTTERITEHVLLHARHLAGPDFVIEVCTALSGPAVIATRESFDLAAQIGLDCLTAQNLQNFDAVLLACFGDPGLEKLQQISPVPVLGLAQSCMQLAQAEGLPYAIMTSGPAWVEILTERLKGWGASDLFCGVELIPHPALQILQDPESAMPAVLTAIARAKARGAQRFILGGTVFVGFLQRMKLANLATEGVVDCLQSAMQIAANGILLKLNQSGSVQI